MKHLLVLLSIALTQARPEAGYSSSSYGVPFGNGGLAGGVGGASASVLADVGGLGGGSIGGLGSGEGGGFGVGGGLGSVGGFGDGRSGDVSIGSGSFNGGIETVDKHIYVHVPAPEAEIAQPLRVIAPSGPPRKHYKIVFIKAPTPPTPTAPVIQPAAQDQEKTLIYVLVKRPEEGPAIVIPTPAPTQPTKPEVYFIRYRTQKASEGVGDIGNSLGDGIGVQNGARFRSNVGGGIGDGGNGNAFVIGNDLAGSSAGVSTSYGTPTASGPY